MISYKKQILFGAAITLITSIALANGSPMNACTFLFFESKNTPATAEARQALNKIDILQRQEIILKNEIKISGNKVKVAFFDADDTLRTSTKGNPSSNSKEEVKILEGVAQKLKSVANDGYLIAIVSNQGGIPKFMTLEQATDVFRHTIKLIVKEGGVIHYFDFAENYDGFRKPNIGMYQRLESMIQAQLGADITIDQAHSYMVGDAAYSKNETRPDGTLGTNFSNSDRLFAENAGLRFIEAKFFFEHSN